MQSTKLFSEIIKRKKSPKKYVTIAERWATDNNPFKILNKSESVQKFNPYHDSRGRFTTGSSAASFTFRTKAPAKQHMADTAVAREKATSATSEYKQRGHIPFESYEKSLETVKQELGCDTKQAEAYYNSVSNFTTSDCKGIRAYQQGDTTANDFRNDAEVIEDYIRKAPQWNGGTLYRGINLKDGKADEVFKPGAELDMQGTSSWSSDVSISEMFTKGTGKGTKVIFQCDKISKATSVKHLSWNAYEDEVLVSKDTKYVSKAVTKKGKYYYVELEEMTSVGKSFNEILKFNPYHDRLGRFASAGSAASFTYKPGASTAHSKAIEREKEKDSTAGKGFKGTLYHGSPNTNIKEFDMKRAGQNTSSGEKLLFFTDSKQMAEDFSYERLDGSSKFFQQRGKKGRVYEVDVEMKNPLDFRKLSDNDIDNILKLDAEGLLTKESIQLYAKSNHQLLKAGLTLTADSLQKLGYDGLIANTGKAGHNSLEYAVVSSEQAKIKKSASDADMKTTANKDMFDSSFQITKADEDKRLVFGWALVSATSDGQQIIDHQGDILDQSELEQGAYEYVLNFRDAGEEHISTLRKKARMVESVVFTAEKLKAMGIPEGIVPYGWWIGFYVDDDRTWELVKNGTYKMFSIEGRAIREPVSEPLTKAYRNFEDFPEIGMWFEENMDATKEDIEAAKEYYKKLKKRKVAKTFSELMKFNPYHDRLGRFTFANGFMNSSYTGDKMKQAVSFSANPETKAGALAIERESAMRHETIGRAYGNTIPDPKNKPPKVTKPKAKKPKEEPKEDENGFKPSKTVDEAKQYAKNKLGIENVDYGKLDIDTINHINQEITAVQKKYPEVSQSVQNIAIDKRQGVYAAAGTGYSGRSTLYIGAKNYGNGTDYLKQSYQRDVDSGFHPANTDYKSIIWHEYGHIYAHSQYKKQTGFGIKDNLGYYDGIDYISKVKSKSFEKGVLRDAANSLKITQKELKSRISRYAEKNPAETFAEAFAEFNNSPTPRPECIAMMKAAGIAK